METIGAAMKRFELAIQAFGTSEGASKGWDARGRGRKDAIDIKTRPGLVNKRYTFSKRRTVEKKDGLKWGWV